jgi:hypothetical protein
MDLPILCRSFPDSERIFSSEYAARQVQLGAVREVQLGAGRSKEQTATARRRFR